MAVGIIGIGGVKVLERIRESVERLPANGARWNVNLEPALIPSRAGFNVPHPAIADHRWAAKVAGICETPSEPRASHFRASGCRCHFLCRPPFCTIQLPTSFNLVPATFFENKGTTGRSRLTADLLGLRSRRGKLSGFRAILARIAIGD